MPKVKICGNTNAEDVKLALKLGADYIGLIFVESKRQVTAEQARQIIREVGDFKNYVGVFCNHPKGEVERIAGALGLKILQFHGDETALYCQGFVEQGIQVIKTLTPFVSVGYEI